MGYDKYKKIEQVSKKFNLIVRNATLIGQLPVVVPSEWLQHTLKLADMVALSNEKVKSERLISPILTEVHLAHRHKLALFSGAELNVQPENNLNGACDFFFSAIPDAYLLEAPIVAFTEAKDEDMDYGIAQCSAQMIAAQIYNQQANRNVPAIWGCATTAGEWRWLKLSDRTLIIDRHPYYLSELSNLLGSFHWVIEQIL